MSRMKPVAVAAVIGDLVGSRAAPDRAALHRRLVEVLRTVSAASREAADPLAVTAGDEFQGTFTTVGAALEACLAVRLALLPGADARFGVGWGPVELLDGRRRTQDGPAWWAARAAIVEVHEVAARAATRSARTAYRRAEGADGPQEAAVAAALLCRDHLLGSMDDRSIEVVRGMMTGRTQAEVADALGISASAVSQRVRADGVAVVVEASRLLGEVR